MTGITWAGTGELLFRENMVLLKHLNPSLCTRIEQAGAGRFACTRNGLSMQTESGLTMIIEGDLAEQSRAFLGTVRFELPPRIIVFYSIGPVFHIPITVSNFNDISKRFIVLEQDRSLLWWFFHLADCREPLRSGKLTVIDCHDKSLLLDELYREKLYLYSGAIKNVIHPKTLALAERFYIDFAALIQETVRVISENQGFVEDNLIGLKQLLTNRAEINRSRDFSGLGGTGRGKPGVLIATGPTLSDQFDLLRRIQDKAILIGCDSAFSILLDHGIIPLFCACIERGEEMHRFLLDTDGFATTLVATPYLHQRTLRAFSGRKIFLFPRSNFVQWLYPSKPSYFECGPSVANFIFRLFEILGCDPIYLVGQDLCYSADDGGTHAQGIRFSHDIRLAELADDQLVHVPGNNGKEVATHRNWARFKDILEYQIRQYKRTVFNVTFKERGALINGAIALSGERFPFDRFQKTIALKGCSIDNEIRHDLPNCDGQQRAIIQKEKQDIQELIAVLESVHSLELNRCEPTATMVGELRNLRDKLLDRHKSSLVFAMAHPKQELNLADYNKIDWGDDDPDRARIEGKSKLLFEWFRAVGEVAERVLLLLEDSSRV